mmetsp:Transcript_62967/g.194941  ORF Transcript_62967/g.194941 Transcript_62967/m.194941 type:complete len:222 (-) Transcript_62967:27-692(-)
MAPLCQDVAGHGAISSQEARLEPCVIRGVPCMVKNTFLHVDTAPSANCYRSRSHSLPDIYMLFTDSTPANESTDDGGRQSDCSHEHTDSTPANESTDDGGRQSDCSHEHTDTSSGRARPGKGGSTPSATSEDDGESSCEPPPAPAAGAKNRRPCKGKRSRILAFASGVESAMTANPHMDLSKLQLPTFVSSDEGIRQKTMRRLSRFQARLAAAGAPRGSDS